ncbi:MAG: hypothetical protein HKM89_01750 [Gemmatimonadales bacterium]|nr:hypothetical protein [Gemmatimonadales bacterium]
MTQQPRDGELLEQRYDAEVGDAENMTDALTRAGSGSGGGERLVLSRELAEFVVAFSGAYQRFSMYPDGHPALETAIHNLSKKLESVFLDRGAVAVGVAPNQLLVAGIPTDPKHVLLRDLAEHLHRRDVGGVKLLRGVKRSELTELFATILRSSSDGPDAVPASSTPPHWKHIRLYPPSYDHLVLFDDADEDDQDVSAGEAWAKLLWIGLARAAVTEELTDEAGSALDADALATAIEEHCEDQDYNKRLLTALTEFTEACRERGRSESVTVQKHFAKLIGRLSEDALQRLLAMRDNGTAQRQFLLESSHVMAAKLVIRLVEAAANASNRSLSPALLQLLHKLATHAEDDGGPRKHHADESFREMIRKLLERWDEKESDATIPAVYERTLAHLPRIVPDEFDEVSAYAPEPDRIVQMSLEGGVMEVGTLRAADYLIARGRVDELLHLIEEAPEADPVAQELKARVVHPYTVSVLLSAPTVDTETLGRMVPECGLDAAGAMFDALATSQDRKVRARLLEFLARFGSDVGPEAAERIAGAPWYVQRNLIKLLSKLPELPEEFSPSACLAHSDARVRHEGFKLLLHDPAMRDRAIREAVAAPDPPTIRLGLVSAMEGCPADAVPVVLDRLQRDELPKDLVPIAVRAIAPSDDPAVLECLLNVATGPRRWYGLRRIAPKSPEMLAAVTALTIHWRWNPKALPVLRRAERHRDKQVRDAAGAHLRLHQVTDDPRLKVIV